MTNHIHLVVTGQHPDSLAKAIQGLGRRYVGYFNTRHERTGTLWEGRYKSSLITSARYLLNTHRYVEQNPVRAGLVRSADDYPWSSHRFYAHGQPDDLVTPHEIWLSLGETQEERRTAFRSEFEVPLDGDALSRIRLATQCGWAIGEDSDRRALQAVAGKRLTPIGRGWKRGRSRKRRDEGV